ncbi:MAG: hypothetical protein CMIDDMOC_00103 [Sodalis sp. Fle]|nr:MAG: hypothetical protein CMIDDMOC_00103 [Sodalis sp. Fle]
MLMKQPMKITLLNMLFTTLIGQTTFNNEFLIIQINKMFQKFLNLTFALLRTSLPPANS